MTLLQLFPSLPLPNLLLASLNLQQKQPQQQLPYRVPFSTLNAHIKENRWNFVIESIPSQMKAGTGQFDQSEFHQEEPWLSILRWT